MNMYSGNISAIFVDERTFVFCDGIMQNCMRRENAINAPNHTETN
jgi:hypothetical protein